MILYRHQKVFRQEAEESAAGEDQCSRIAYNKRLRASQSPNKLLVYSTLTLGPFLAYIHYTTREHPILRPLMMGGGGRMIDLPSIQTSCSTF